MSPIESLQLVAHQCTDQWAQEKIFEIVAELNAQLAACAAGPWRFDVENAPKDGTNLLIAWRWLGNIQIDRLFWCGSYGFWTDGSGIRCCIMHDTVVAFAVPNPPQKTGD